MPAADHEIGRLPRVLRPNIMLRSGQSWFLERPIAALAPLEVPSGIKIRDIAQMARQLMIEHHLCPHGNSYSHRDDGTIKVHVIFQSEMQLRADDPYVRQRRRGYDELKGYYARQTAAGVQVL